MWIAQERECGGGGENGKWAEEGPDELAVTGSKKRPTRHPLREMSRQHDEGKNGGVDDESHG